MFHFRSLAFAAAAAIAGLAAIPAAAQSADGNDRRILIENRSGQAVVFVYGSPTTDRSFGQDRIPDRVLRRGQRTIVNFDNGSRACMWDLRATLADGSNVDRMNVNVCRVSRWRINRRGSTVN